MSLQKEITELGKAKIQQWRTIMDELDVQLALGKVEIKDMLNKEKQNLSAYIEKQNELFKEEEKLARQDQVELKTQLEDLYLQLQKDMPSSKRAYDKAKKEGLRMIHELEFQLKENAADYHSWLGILASEMKDSLDEYRIKLALSSYESQDECLESKKELQEDLRKSFDKITKEIYPEEKRVNHFINEVSSSLEHLKRAFSDILG